MYYGGIDPGATGGVAIINGDGELVLAELFSTWKTLHDMLKAYSVAESSSLFALEKVSAMPGQGVVSMFTFGQNYGGWRSLLEGLQIPFIEPVPRKWQTSVLGAIPKGESKAKAMEYVSKRYPQLQLRKKDSGIADAICLALYAKQHI